MAQDKPKRVVTDYNGVLVGTLIRNPLKEFRVYLRESHDVTYVEIRKWVHLDRYDGPDRQGVTFMPDEVEGIVELIRKAGERYKDSLST